ncbi:hypothetical protein JCM8115_000634 [Rhodotorula mucilaginosa]
MHGKTTSISTASSWSSRVNERVSFFASSSPSTSSSTPPTWSSSPSSTSASSSEAHGGYGPAPVGMDSAQGLGISEGWHEIAAEPSAQHEIPRGAYRNERSPNPLPSGRPSSHHYGPRSNDFCVRADPVLVLDPRTKPDSATAPPSRLRRVSTYLSVRGALHEAQRLIRQAVSSTHNADGTSHSHYPPSPSLLRPHPSVRHGASSTLSPRRAVRQAGLVVLLLVVLGFATHDLSRIRNSARAMRAYFDPSLNSSSSFSTAKAAHPLPLADEDDEDLLPIVTSSPRDDSAGADASTHEAEAKAQQVVDHAVEMAAKKRKAKKKQKDASKYKRLLPLGAPPRRYRYGANFVIAEDDTEAQITVKDPERTNGVIRVPSQKQLERIHEIGRKRYLAEEADWRAYEWQAPPPHSSLIRFADKLTSEELELRKWIQLLQKRPTSRGVGLGARENDDASSALTLAPMPVFDRGDRIKWTDLATQAESGHAGKCQGSTWQEDYRKMHAEMLDGKRDPHFISYHCEQGMNCGGLGDRLLGMTSAFFFGLVTQRAFLAEWQAPVPLDVIFDSPYLNWSHSSFTTERHRVLGRKQVADAAADLDIIHFDRLAVDATFGSVSWNAKRDRPLTPGFELRDLAYRSPWIKFFSNRGMVYRAFKYKHLKKRIGQLGLQEQTAFSCISDYLFQPKPAALDLITQYTSVMALPTVFSVGIHVRTGDQSMKDAQYDKVNTVKRHISFFRCARELGETYARPDQRVVFYLVTDSQHLKEDAQRVLGTKLITTDFAPQHVHQKSGHVDGVMSAVVEDYVLAKADMLVATQDSGFGKLASFMMAKPNSTVTIFPKFNPDVLGLRGKHSHLSVDCTSPTVFTSYEELSSEWSLG